MVLSTDPLPPPSPAAGHLFYPYCPVFGLPAVWAVGAPPQAGVGEAALKSDLFYTRCTTRGGDLNYHCAYLLAVKKEWQGPSRNELGTGQEVVAPLSRKTGRRCWAKTIQSYNLTIITAKNRPALTIERVRLLPVKPSIQMGYNQLKE